MHPTTRFRLAAASVPTALLFAAGTANAATCEEAFVKKGNPITGLRFTAAVTAHVTPASSGSTQGATSPPPAPSPSSLPPGGGRGAP